MPARTKPSEFLLAVALLAFAGFWLHALTMPAAPQPPAPAAVQIELKPQTVLQSPALYERGTERSPLIVQFSDTSDARARAARQDAIAHEQSQANQHIILVAGLLAAVGFIQFLAMIVQAYWMKRWVQSAPVSRSPE